MQYKKNILITGACGFIGCHVADHFTRTYPEYNIIVLDNLTYAGNINNIKHLMYLKNFEFIKGDITDNELIEYIFETRNIDSVIHLAAESHVDRSISNPLEFLKTNILGTVTLLENAKKSWWGKFEGKKFYHISTDEVYGTLSNDFFHRRSKFKETNKYEPHSPYSASKASSDHFVRAYHDTYGLPTVISNCSNNYGPNQFPEKLIPLAISKLKKGEKIPVYGDGKNVRDWLFVLDHVSAIDKIFHEGKVGDTFNIGGNNEMTNIDIIKEIISTYYNNENVNVDDYIVYVPDRLGHDKRYAIDATKIKKKLNWKPSLTFKEAIKLTVDWYKNNCEWMDNIENGKYINDNEAFSSKV